MTQLCGINIPCFINFFNNKKGLKEELGKAIFIGIRPNIINNISCNSKGKIVCKTEKIVKCEIDD